MKKHSLKLALLCGVLLASAFGARPAAALPSVPVDPFVSQQGACLAVLYSKAARAVIEITDSGVTGKILCHTATINDSTNTVILVGNVPTNVINVVYSGDSTIAGEAFNVCIGGKFHEGAASSFYVPRPAPSARTCWRPLPQAPAMSRSTARSRSRGTSSTSWPRPA